MKLILTEKADVARSFSSALGCEFKDGYYINPKSGYLVTNGVGHLFELYKPEDYSELLKVWDITRLPIVPKKWQYKAINEGHILKQINIVKKAFKDNAIDSVIVAGDPGREGELIARVILQNVGAFDKDYQFYRLWTSKALSDSVIVEELQHLKKLSDYDKIYSQGLIRSQLDWLIGINYSRLFSLSFGASLSFGRVQTCLLKRQYDLNQKIKSFSESHYYKNQFYLEGFCFSYIDESQKDDSLTEAEKKEKALAIQKQIKEKEQVFKIIKETKEEQPPKLYDLTELQKVCNKKYKFSAKKTLEIAQRLYEVKKILSYPRTPSRCMNDGDYEFFCGCLSKLQIKKRPEINNKNIFNSSKVEDHHALVLLEKPSDDLTEDEKKITSLILERMKVVLEATHRYEQITSTVEIGEEKLPFKNITKVVKEMGWRAFEEDEKEDLKDENEEIQLQSHFSLQEKNDYNTTQVNVVELKTKPAQYDNEGSLLSWMKKYSLGTPATRAGIIETLLSKNKGYCVLEKNKIIITEKGISYIETITKNEKIIPLLEKENTKNFEENIEKSPESMIEDFIVTFKEVKEFFQNNNFVVKKQSCPKFEEKCPICGRTLLASKFGWYCPEKCLSIPNRYCEASISADEARLLLQGKQTKVKKMTSKAGQSFNAKIKLNIKEKKLELIFK